MKKHHILIAALFILSFVVVYAFFRFISVREQQLSGSPANNIPPPRVISLTPTPTLVPIPLPATSITQTPVYVIAQQERPAPTIPIYTVSSPAPSEIGSRLASVLPGLPSAPQSIQTPKGTFVSWSGADASLTVGSNPVVISYAATFSFPLSRQRHADTDVDSAARAFLQSNNLIPEGTRLSDPAYRYLRPTETDPYEVRASEATVTEVSYDLLIGENIYTTGNAFIHPVTLWFDSNLRILRLSAVAFSIQPATVSKAVLTANEAQEQLNQNKGVLLSFAAQSQVNRIQPQPYTVETVGVERLSLGYYHAPSQQELVPVYIAFGASRDQITGEVVRSVSLVRASAE